MPLQVRASLGKADVIILLPVERYTQEPSPAVHRALHTAYHRGAIIAAFCTSTFFLAATGLLNGHRATTHWGLTDDLARSYPDIVVVPDALYIDEGSIMTGAGGAAGIDMILHLLRREYGAAVANAVTREMVLAPHPRRRPSAVPILPCSFHSNTQA
jgi:transcriptional regulator GlxA family with amidase domain